MSRIKPGEVVVQSWFKTLDGKAWPKGSFEKPEISQRNTEVIAVSADTKELSDQARNELVLSQLKLGMTFTLRMRNGSSSPIKCRAQPMSNYFHQYAICTHTK